MQWLIFDAIGVVYETGDDTRELLIPYIQQHHNSTDVPALEALYLQASLGSITPEEFWTAAGFQNPKEAEKFYLDTRLTLDAEFPFAAARLASRFRIGMLSNDIAQWSLHLRQRFGIEPLFHCAVISSAVRCRKPDSKIYEILCATIGSEPKDCIFVDDRVQNLIPAQALGMRAILFNRDGADSKGFESVTSFAELETLLQG